MTKNVLAILRAVLDAPEPSRERFGYEIVRETGLTSGSVYPVLHRLEEEEGWLVSDEKPSPTKGRPHRRCYRFTDAGMAGAREVLGDNQRHAL